MNTDGVPPMSSVADLTLPMRKDVVNDGGQFAAVLANAPDAVVETDGGFFTVPKMVE